MLNEAGTAGQTKTYTNLRGIKIGLTGLTANAYVYAENGVKYTQTPSGTTVLIGKSKGTTAVLLDLSVPGTVEATDAQAINPVLRGVYMGPQETYQALQSGKGVYAADAVGTDSYAITLSPVPTAYTTGMRVFMNAGTANTGACTLNVNALGVKAIKKEVSVDLQTGDILANQIIELVYDGTNFQLVGAIPVAINALTVSKARVFAYTTNTLGASASEQKITFTSEITDAQSNWASDTFTAPRTGYYIITFQGKFSANAVLRIKKNGGTLNDFTDNNGTFMSVSGVYSLVANDTIDFHFRPSGTQGLSPYQNISVIEL
jgi:hypothetical protein